MKHIAAILIAVICTGTALASEPSINQPQITWNQKRIEQNILANLESENVNIQANTVQLIIDLSKSNIDIDLDFTVVPLLDMLKTNSREELRIYSALALFHLQSDIGRFAVTRRVTYDNSMRVSKMCERLAQHWDESQPDGDNYAYTDIQSY